MTEPSERQEYGSNATPAPFPYFSIIRLRHLSGLYLGSLPHQYQHASTSGQQIVGCLEMPYDSTLWVVRPPHRLDYSKTGKDEVQNGESIRLQHLRTGRNLHAHDRKAAVSDQQEITAFGEEGLGNHDDDWVISTRDQGQLNSLKVVTLKNIQQNTALHSHSNNVTLENSDSLQNQITFQEVTGFTGDDENNDWTVTEVLPPPQRLVLHPFYTIKFGDVSKSFNTSDEMLSWMTAEKTSFNWLAIAAQQGGHTRIHSLIASWFSEIENQISTVQTASSTTKDFSNKLRSLETQIEQTLTNRFLFLEGDSIRSFILSLKDKDPALASQTLAYFCGADLETSPKSLQGYFRALCFEQNISDKASAEAQAIVELKNSLAKGFDDVVRRVDGTKTAFEGHLKSAAQTQQEQDDKFRNIIEERTKEFEVLKKTYDQEMSLRASVSYWKNKASSNKTAAKWFGATAALIGILFAGGLVLYANTVLQGAADTPPKWWEVGTMVILATFGIWAIRVFVQLMYSNTHLASDASERVTMIMTYLAMMRESVLPTAEQHKLLILQALFRPGSTGVIKDDGSPSTWLDFIAQKVGGR